MNITFFAQLLLRLPKNNFRELVELKGRINLNFEKCIQNIFTFFSINQRYSTRFYNVAAVEVLGFELVDVNAYR